jgi:hypothetical protein
MERQAEAIESGADEVLSTTGPTEHIVAAVERLVFSEAKRRRLVRLEDQAQPSHVV